MTYDTRNGPRDRRLRVGNDEREAVAEILRREHVAGRLDNEEFDERPSRDRGWRDHRPLSPGRGQARQR